MPSLNDEPLATKGATKALGSNQGSHNESWAESSSCTIERNVHQSQESAAAASGQPEEAAAARAHGYHAILAARAHNS